MATQAIGGERAAPKAHRKLPSEINILLVLIGIALIFEILGWIFQGQTFLGNIGRLKIMILQVSVIGIIAVGVTQVIISGGIDLSSGSIVGAVAMVSMSFAQSAEYARAVYPALTDMPPVALVTVRVPVMSTVMITCRNTTGTASLGSLRRCLRAGSLGIS